MQSLQYYFYYPLYPFLFVLALLQTANYSHTHSPTVLMQNLPQHLLNQVLLPSERLSNYNLKKKGKQCLQPVHDLSEDSILKFKAQKRPFQVSYFIVCSNESKICRFLLLFGFPSLLDSSRKSLAFL